MIPIWLIVSLSVFGWAFLSIFVFLLKEKQLKEFFKQFYLVMVVAIIATILSPFILVAALVFGLDVLEGKSPKGYKLITRFYIPKPTEGIKEALRQLGFEEGTHDCYWASKHFDGFKRGAIEVGLDGRCVIWGEISDSEKRLMEILKTFQSPENEIRRVEGAIESNTRILKGYQKDIAEYKDKLKKLKETK